jgi:hypothetical protein
MSFASVAHLKTYCKVSIAKMNKYGDKGSPLLETSLVPDLGALDTFQPNR